VVVVKGEAVTVAVVVVVVVEVSFGPFAKLQAVVLNVEQHLYNVVVHKIVDHIYSQV
jgi:hypothetical protein